MSDEPQPLRLKPRLPSAAGSAPPQEAPPPPPPAPGADAGEGIGRLRLKAKLGLSDGPSSQSASGLAADPSLAPPPPPPAAAPFPEPPAAAAEPEPSDAPKFKLRPKAAAPAPQPGALAEEPPAPLPDEAAALSPPPPARSSQSMPPMSILTAPPPPPLGSVAEAPAPPGAAPRLSLSTASLDKGTGTKGLPVPGADSLPKIGGKPIVVKPGKPAAILRRRPTLGPMAKAGVTVVVIAVAVGAFYSYRIFFPAETPDMKIRLPPVAKPIGPSDKQPGPGGQSKVGAPGQPAEKGGSATAGQAEGNASGQERPPTPVPTPASTATETVMGESTITTDVRVNNTPIEAATAASAAFRAFVSNATVGGVYQGVPSRALINGTIVREGQTLDSALGIAFVRVDAAKKVIYFKDYTGAVVSKNY